jgi:hypothetical protein
MSLDHEKSDAYLVRCPQCGKQSNAIKVFHFPIIIFLIVFFYAFKKRIAACPSCQRTNTGFYALINLPALHFLWPIIHVPLIVFYLTCTFIPGHSRAVQEMFSLRK